MSNNTRDTQEPVELSASVDLTDRDLEVVTAGKGGGLGGPASGLGVRPGVGVGAPGLGMKRGLG